MNASTAASIEFSDYDEFHDWEKRRPMLEINPHAEGCVLAVRAQPGARKNAVVGEQAGALKVAVTAPPEDGRANSAITDLLRDWLGLKRSQVELLNGPTNRNKAFLIRGLAAEELRALIDSKLKGA
jgi:uncharacterized protein (TIGR00251 family)